MTVPAINGTNGVHKTNGLNGNVQAKGTTNGAPVPKHPSPSHPDIAQVVFAPGDYKSKLVALKPFPANSVICPINGTTSSHKAYSSVQVCSQEHLASTNRPSPHIELNSDLVYMNHSCDPSVTVEVNGKDEVEGGWKVRALKDIEIGQDLTFFYPSTEWDMDQPFDCECGAKQCLGRITGAKDIPESALNRYVLNEHIRQMKNRQVAESS